MLRASSRATAAPSPQGADDEEKPLDPTLERVRRKLVWLMAASIGLLFLGLVAVFGAILYRTNNAGAPDVAPASSITLPAGARLVSADLSGERLLLDLEAASGERTLMVVDLTSGRTVSSIDVRR